MYVSTHDCVQLELHTKPFWLMLGYSTLVQTYNRLSDNRVSSVYCRFGFPFLEPTQSLL